MPAFIRLEKAKSFSGHYERGWNYVEERRGRLVMVRNKKDGFDNHRGGWVKTKPREKIVKEVFMVEPDVDRACKEPRPVRKDGRLFIDIDVPQHRRRRGSSSDDSPPPSPPLRPRVQVHRPVRSSPEPFFESQEIQPRRCYFDEAAGRLVKKVPVERHRLQRVRPVDILEHDPSCPEENEEDYFYETVQDPRFQMFEREPRPYHMSEPEDSYWDDDQQAWMVSRRPRVRFG